MQEPKAYDLVISDFVSILFLFSCTVQSDEVSPNLTRWLRETSKYEVIEARDKVLETIFATSKSFSQQHSGAPIIVMTPLILSLTQEFEHFDLIVAFSHFWVLEDILEVCEEFWPIFILIWILLVSSFFHCHFVNFLFVYFGKNI
jgi:hypothetical protein